MKKTMQRAALGYLERPRASPPSERFDESLLFEDPLDAEPAEILTGNPPIEPRPTNQDILPDQVYRRGAEPDEEQVTARPTEPPQPQTIPPPDHPQDMEDDSGPD